jgi:hypothetical protein
MKELNKFREFLAENAIANDKGDGTFEITADIDILGKKFNFSDICPGAHKAIGDLAKEYANNDDKLGDLLYLANLQQDFFNLEKKALGAQGIDEDELYDIKRLYAEITNIAFNAFGPEAGGDVTEYMNMHMEKILNADRKASQPGGSSDMNENDKALNAIINEGKAKDFLLKILFKTADFVSPDTLKYVYSELVKQVGEEEANETFQELNLDPSDYKE